MCKNATLTNNINLLMNKQKVSATELSQASGIDKGRISRLANGKTTNPQIETLLPIARFFGISVEQLVGSSPLLLDNTYGVITPIKRLLIPIIDWKNITYWLEIKQQYISKATIDVKTAMSCDSFALTMESDVYEPRFTKDATITVDPHTTPNNRDYYLKLNKQRNIIEIEQAIIEGNAKYSKNLLGKMTMTKVKSHYPSYGVIYECHLPV